MPSATYECLKCRYQEEVSWKISEGPPSDQICYQPIDPSLTSCLGKMERIWEAPQFICDRADRDPDYVPPEHRVSREGRPISAEKGKKIEAAYQENIHKRRREIAESGGGALKQTHQVPAHLYHGKIKQTGDKNYWLDKKNREKHISTRVDRYGRSRRGRG